MVLANQNAKLTGPDQGFLVSRLVLTLKPWERGWGHSFDVRRSRRHIPAYTRERAAAMGVCKSRNPTRNTRNPPGTPPGTPGTPPGTPGTTPGTPGTPPGTPGSPPGTPGTPPGTRRNTSYEAMHVFLYKFTCFALNSG